MQFDDTVLDRLAGEKWRGDYHLDMPTKGHPEAYLQFREGMFNVDGSVGADSKPFLQNGMDSFVAWVAERG